ncbi:response regulator [Oryzibacter oryziterrae]|uniref:response regulator n=1 Tax=Oryzibacter oryziterrae TaxID=2766474 RepID=UPI001F0225ED|nr:response regulator [Oryzibacter oryziterrae]
MQPHILLVEDDNDINSLVARYLRANDCRVSVAREGREMDKILSTSRIDLIVLDIMLPGEDGLSICRRLRSSSTIPIIIVSARGEEIDRVVGLEIGADDYLAKPFSARELLARIRAILRRSTVNALRVSKVDATTLSFAGWTVDLKARSLTSPAATQVTLTGAEFDLLVTFAERPGLTLSRDQLLDLTQGRVAAPFERSIDILVSRLRRKLDVDDGKTEFIRTIRSEGYLFTPEVELT